MSLDSDIPIPVDPIKVAVTRLGAALNEQNESIILIRKIQLLNALTIERRRLQELMEGAPPAPAFSVNIPQVLIRTIGPICNKGHANHHQQSCQTAIENCRKAQWNLVDALLPEELSAALDKIREFFPDQ